MYCRSELLTFLSSNAGCPACAFYRSASLASGGGFFDAGATVALSTDMVFHMLSSSVVSAVDVTSVEWNGPGLADSSLLYGSVARRSAANVVIRDREGYTYYPVSFFFDASFIFLS